MEVISKIEAVEVHKAEERLATLIIERHRTNKPLVIIGIANGGLALCSRLVNRLTEAGLVVEEGCINAMFHRDDIGIQPIPKNFNATDLPFEIDDATVILVDDVLHSGRTVRAAMNELFDHGRPERVELAVLCDRGGARLPIRADYVGLTLNPEPLQAVRVELDPTDPQRDALYILAL